MDNAFLASNEHNTNLFLNAGVSATITNENDLSGEFDKIISNKYTNDYCDIVVRSIQWSS